MIQSQKNKLVFFVLIGMALLFVLVYSVMILGEEEIPSLDTGKIPIPELKEDQETYQSKLDALNDLKEVRETNAPSIYDESMLDSSGRYDPSLIDREKQRLVDSIYKEGRINYEEQTYRKKQEKGTKINETVRHTKGEESKSIKKIDFAKNHVDFFSSIPKTEKEEKLNQNTDSVILVEVHGKQQVQAYGRLTLITLKESTINGKKVPKNSFLYGFVSFKPNRTLIHITNINQQKVSLKAFDLQDGNEGIYVENNFKTEVSNQVLTDLVDQVNIPGVPSLDVVKKVFQQSNKRLKVTITDHYQLLLKPTL
jgi:hypothetical protein